MRTGNTQRLRRNGRSWLIAGLVLVCLCVTSAQVAGSAESVRSVHEDEVYVPLSVADTFKLNLLLSHGFWNDKHPLGDRLKPAQRWFNIAGNPLAVPQLIENALLLTKEGELDGRARLKLLGIGYLVRSEDLHTLVTLVSDRQLTRYEMIRPVVGAAVLASDRGVADVQTILKRVLDFEFWSEVKDPRTLYSGLLFTISYSEGYSGYLEMIQRINSHALKAVPATQALEAQFEKMHRRCRLLYGKEIAYCIDKREAMNAKIDWAQHVDAPRPAPLQALVGEELRQVDKPRVPSQGQVGDVIREASGKQFEIGSLTFDEKSAMSQEAVKTCREALAAHEQMVAQLLAGKYMSIAGLIMDNGQPVAADKLNQDVDGRVPKLVEIGLRKRRRFSILKPADKVTTRLHRQGEAPMSKRYGKMEEMSTADLGFSLEDVRARSLDEVARMGAKLVLEVAMGEEVAEFLGRNRYDRADAERPGYRNGTRR